MAKFIVMKESASAFGDRNGHYPVVKGVVDMPVGSLSADLLDEGIIAPAPAKAEKTEDPEADAAKLAAESEAKAAKAEKAAAAKAAKATKAEVTK